MRLVSLLICMANKHGQNNISPIFRYDYYSGRRIAAKEGQKYNLSAIEYHINLHLRGGYVIPTQIPGNTTTEESRKNHLQLIAALDLDKHAKGDLYIDDGKSINPTISMNPTFTVEANNFTIITNASNYLNLKDLYNPYVDMIKIFGVIDSLYPEYFNISCCDLNEVCSEPHKYVKDDYIHDPYSGVLTLRHLIIDFKECDKFFIYWNHKDWDKEGNNLKKKP